MIDKKAIKRILVIRFSCVGDVLLTTPALATVRKRFPDSHITYLTERASGEVLRHNPDIDRIIFLQKGIVAALAREKPYDLVINFDWFRSSHALSYLAQARYSIGFPIAACAPYHLASCETYTAQVKRLRKKNDMIDKFLAMTRALGLKDHTRDTALYLTQEERARAAAYVRRHRFSGRLIVGMHPDGRKKHELWPAGRFAELADRLITERQATVFLFRGPGEEKGAMDVYKKVAHKKNVHIVAELSLRNYAALVNNCDVFIAHDRGPMHIAIALGVKTVAIFTTPCAKEWFPYREKNGCDYLEKANAKLITVNEVLRKINGVLSAMGDTRMARLRSRPPYFQSFVLLSNALR